MALVSIRTLNVGLVATCTVVVGLICTVLSVTSADTALSDTKDARDNSIGAALSSGEEQVTDLTEAFLAQVGATIDAELTQFWGKINADMTGTCDLMMHSDPDKVETWDYIYEQRHWLYNLMRKSYGMNSLGVLTEKMQYVLPLENSQTMNNPIDGFHHYHMLVNNGTDYDNTTGIPAVNRSHVAEIIRNGAGDPYGYPHNTSNLGGLCQGLVAIATNGEQLEAPCLYPPRTLSQFNPLYGRFPMGMLQLFPPTNSASFVLIHGACDYGNPVTKKPLGTVMTGVDLRRITYFLQNIDLGAGSLGRLFVVVRKNWAAATPGEQEGYLTGTSHGTAFHEDESQNQGDTGYVRRTPQSARNCSDVLVSRSATYLEETVMVNGTGMWRYEQLMLSGKSDTFTLETDRKPSGEPFYVRVRRFKHLDAFGLDWYVVSLIDRQYVMWRVDAVSHATRISIQRSEETVDDDLKRARITLYVAVVTSAVLLLVAAVLLVFRITAPLMQLMQDMSRVAVMDLSSVDLDKAPSSIAELAGMQRSFILMVKNLVEYRQYLPQSVLVDSVTEDESTQGGEGGTPTGLHSVSYTRSTGSKSSRSQMTVARPPVFDSSLHTRSISVLVSNIKGVHAIKTTKEVRDVMVQYLEQFMTHAGSLRGLIEDVSGDKVKVSFNSMIPAATHRTSCLELALLVQSSLPTPVNFAASAGSAVCGNMGCTGLKKYASIGNPASNAFALERAGNAWGASLLCDGTVGADSIVNFLMRKICKATLKGGKTSFLFQVMRRKEAANDEWMYQLEEADSKDPYKGTNSAVTKLYDGDFSAARQHIEAHDGAEKSYTSVLLRRALSAGALEPVDIHRSLYLVPEERFIPDLHA